MQSEVYARPTTHFSDVIFRLARKIYNCLLSFVYMQGKCRAGDLLVCPAAPSHLSLIGRCLVCPECKLKQMSAKGNDQSEVCVQCGPFSFVSGKRLTLFLCNSVFEKKCNSCRSQSQEMILHWLAKSWPDAAFNTNNIN